MQHKNSLLSLRLNLASLAALLILSIGTKAQAQSYYQIINLGNIPVCSTNTFRINGFHNDGVAGWTQTDYFTATLSGSPDFSLPPIGRISDDCNGRYTTNATCRFYLTFSPKTPGLHTVVLTENESAQGTKPNGETYSFTASYLIQVNATAVGTSTCEPALLNLSIPQNASAFSAIPSETTGNNKFSVKPDEKVSLRVKVTGEHFNTPENRTATLTLKVNGHSLPPKSVSVAAIQAAGSAGYYVSVDHTFTAEDAGEVQLSATISSPDDTIPSDNTSREEDGKMYVVCDVADKQVTVPFWSQGEIPWGNQYLGIPANSTRSPPATMAGFGCSVTAFAMLASSTKYGIKNVPFGSPLNPASDGGPNLPGLNGELINPGTLNSAFANYKTASTGRASVVFNLANDPDWKGMAQVARAGYKYQCSLTENNCNPDNYLKSISFTAIKGENFNPDIKGEDQKLVMRNICRGNPVILKFKSNSAAGQHFMLAKSFEIDTNGRPNYTLSNPATAEGAKQLQSDLVRDYPFIMGYSEFKPEKDPSMMSIFAPLSVHFLVTDPLGRRSGYDLRTHTAYSEIPGADYFVQSINTPSEAAEQETLVAERMFASVEDTPAGNFKIETFAVESGNYYLDIRKTDTNGQINDADYITGILAAGQSEEKAVTHIHEPVPETNAKMNLLSYAWTKRSEDNSDVFVFLKGQIQNLSGSPLVLSNKFKLVIGGVNGYKLEIPASQFRATNYSLGKIYTYMLNGVKILVSSAGDIEVIINQVNLQNVSPDKAGQIRIDIDSSSADTLIEMNCNSNFCTK